MKLKFTASTIKSWFQYRCERKIVYEAMDQASKDLVPIKATVVDSPWVVIGNDFEADVIAKLRRDHPGQVLVPLSGDALSLEMTEAFLNRKRQEIYAHQAVFTESERLRRLLGLTEDVRLLRGKPDLIQVTTDDDGNPVFHIIDVKATQGATVFHKAQVAFYALMLRAILLDLGAPGRIANEGQIWHLPPTGVTGGGEYEKESFKLAGYEALVQDFFRRQVPAMTERRVEPDKDDTFFHLYFKCEQCPYMAHCIQAIDDAKAPAAWDVSAVPGLTHESKRALARMRITKVGELAQAKNLAINPEVATWALKTKGEDMTARAGALVTGEGYRKPDRYSHLMPPKTDVAIYLVVDHDPVDGHLAALGCRITRDEGVQEESVIAIADPRDELSALKLVMGKVAATLAAVDAANRDHQAGHIAHIFLYEPSEAQDLQAALGRHLEDPEVRAGLLHMVRMFPPEETLPEPEYKGVHHLPASAIRSVVSALYVLPVKVSSDLARVSQALTQLDPSFGGTYVPAPAFARQFSSRLALEVTRELRRGTIEPAEVERDVADRLLALDAIRQWIEADNATAAKAFLRLNKRPFRFQADFHPLQANDLDVLLAQEILDSRSTMLARLVELALPAEERRDRYRCFAQLSLIGSYEHPWSTGMRFHVPEASRQAELSHASFGLILHNDDPDIRLNPQRWSQFQVSLAPADPQYGNQTIMVNVPKTVYKSPEFQALLRDTPKDGWFIDEIHLDVNTPKISDYLVFLAKGSV